MGINGAGCLASWREAVQKAAHQAALIELEVKLQCAETAFNYRWEHVQAVVRTALQLAALTGADAETVEAAAWLHDVAKKGNGRAHGQEGASLAREILAQTDFPPIKVEAVAEAIQKHVGLFVPPETRIEPLEAAVLWDADKLTKLGAIAVLHFIGYGVTRGQGTEQLVARLPGTGNWQPATVASLQTEAARKAGRERWAMFERFCRQAKVEFGVQDLEG
jgi:uncharacterized protein